jgi:hypothetical protein
MPCYAGLQVAGTGVTLVAASQSSAGVAPQPAGGAVAAVNGVAAAGGAVYDEVALLSGQQMEEAGSLMVEVKAAADLIAADKGGSSDPYVSLKLGKKKGSTKSIKKTLAPRWNETLKFSGALGELLGAGDLLVKVMDRDRFDSDDALGSLNVSLEPLRRATKFELNDAALQGVKSGTISLAVSWVPNAAKGAAAAAATAALDTEDAALDAAAAAVAAAAAEVAAPVPTNEPASKQRTGIGARGGLHQPEPTDTVTGAAAQPPKLNLKPGSAKSGAPTKLNDFSPRFRGKSMDAEYAPCEAYVVDMAAATFGACKCGRPKAEHSAEAIANAPKSPRTKQWGS